MAKRLVPSSFECDCGHRFHFSENTVREMESVSRRRRKPQHLVEAESGAGEHEIAFEKGEATAVIYPKLGRCSITGRA